MPMSNYPNGFKDGVNVRGMPVLNTYGGNVYWVDSGASDQGPKGTFDRPVLTIDAAVALATASNGDYIMIKPGHAENIADATTFQVDKAGLTIVGLGVGTNRPTFTYTGTAGSIEVDSANCTIENIRMVAGIDQVVVAVNVDAANCTLRGCEWNYSTAGYDFQTMVNAIGNNWCTIEGCEGITQTAPSDTGVAQQAILFANSDYLRVKGNVFHGDFAVAAIKGSTDTSSGAAASEGIVIEGNRIRNQVTDTTLTANCIDIDAAATGILSFNHMWSDLKATTALDPGSLACFENYVVGEVNKSAALQPATVDT